MNYSHTFNPQILRKYDIRGIVGETLTEDDAFAIGMSFVHYLRLQNINPIIAVIKDARHSGIVLKQKVIEGITFAGGKVFDCGIGTTPMVYFASNHLNTSGFIAITGSHNPINHNGFKLGITGKAFSEEEIQEIGNIAKQGVEKQEGGKCETVEVLPQYIARILQDFTPPQNLKFGFNALNGAGGIVLPELLKKTGGMIFECETNPNLQTDLDPSAKKNIEKIQEDIQTHNLDIIFAFDGDADRIMAITKTKVLFGEDILYLCAREVLVKEKGKVIFDVKCSNTLAKEIKKCGGAPILYKTGHSLIKKKMLEEDAVLAGECSGHIYFKNGYYGFDDGIYTAIRLLSYFAKNNFQNEIDSFPKTFKSTEIKIPCNEKFEVIEKLQQLMKMQGKEFNNIDGVRANFSPTAWLLIRASNTEEILVVRYESETEEEFLQVQKHTENLLKKVLSQ